MKLYSIDEYKATSAAGFTKRMVQQSEHGLVFVLNFAPGQQLPPHTHEKSEIFVTVFSGEGRATVDSNSHALRAGSAISCQGNETFSVENTGRDALSLLVFLYPGNPKFAGDVR